MDANKTQELLKALEDYRGNVAAVAGRLGVSEWAVRKRMAARRISPDDYRNPQPERVAATHGATQRESVTLNCRSTNRSHILSTMSTQPLPVGRTKPPTPLRLTAEIRERLAAVRRRLSVAGNVDLDDNDVLEALVTDTLEAWAEHRERALRGEE